MAEASKQCQPINITEHFYDNGAFDAMRNNILIKMVESQGCAQMWVVQWQTKNQGTVLVG
jgi:hypothetical protein